MITEATCVLCGQKKPLDELNGYDPITQDYSKAYCRRLPDCKSEHTEKIFDEIHATKRSPR